jgi:hypothetical protein
MKPRDIFAYCLICLLFYQCQNTATTNSPSLSHSYSIDYKTMQSPNTVAQTLGINTIWGWGHPQGNNDTTKGAHFFCQLTPNIRSYHEWNWDTPTPNTTPNYTQMAQGNGTEAQNWLNWDTEYALWKKAGANIQVSIKFDNQTQPLWIWDNPYQNAYNYGYAFAKHFGQMHGNGLVDALEIGNEPWNYPPIFYQNVLNGMANGIRTADSTLVILPCALQCNNPNAENTDLKNYAPTRLTPQAISKLSGFNGHYYSYGTNTKGLQIALPPEHPNSTFRAILADLRFRDTYLPKKAFYVTEFGWDSSSANETCTHPECVSEEQQAAYALRAFLVLMRLGVDRAYWYFYANTDNTKPSKLYARSGLTESVDNHFIPKKSFFALQQFIKIMGNTYFINTIQENEQAYVYAFGNSPQNSTHWVMWQPNNQNTIIDLREIPHLPKKNYRIWQWNDTSKQFITQNLAKNTKIMLSEMPIILE